MFPCWGKMHFSLLVKQTQYQHIKYYLFGKKPLLIIIYTPQISFIRIIISYMNLNNIKLTLIENGTNRYFLASMIILFLPLQININEFLKAQKPTLNLFSKIVQISRRYLSFKTKWALSSGMFQLVRIFRECFCTEKSSLGKSIPSNN